MLLLFLEMGAVRAGKDPSKKRAKNSSSHAKNACLSSAERFAQSILSKSPVVVPPGGAPECRAGPTKLLWFDNDDEVDDALLGGGGGGGFVLPVADWEENLSRAEPYDLTPALLT